MEIEWSVNYQINPVVEVRDTFAIISFRLIMDMDDYLLVSQFREDEVQESISLGDRYLVDHSKSWDVLGGDTKRLTWKFGRPVLNADVGLDDKTEWVTDEYSVTVRAERGSQTDTQVILNHIIVKTKEVMTNLKDKSIKHLGKMAIQPAHRQRESIEY